MKNIAKILIATVGIALIFTACLKEGALPFYKNGNATVLSNNTSSAHPAVSDSSKIVYTLNWSWPNYTTDSSNQKFVIQIDSAGHNFLKPVTRVVKGAISSSFTAKDLNDIVFGFGDINAPYTLEMQVLSSYGNNNEQYKSNPVTLVVTPYVIPITLTLTPAGPLTLTVENAANTAVTFNWNATVFGNLPLNYAIQIVRTDSSFTTPKVLTFGTALTGGMTVSDLNTVAVNAGIAANTTGSLAFRVIAYQGTNFANPLASNVVNLTVTTYLSIMTWYIPGDYVSASYPGSTFLNWDPANSPQIKSTATAPTKLEGYVYMANTANNWKFATQPNWNGPNYGDDNNSGVLNPNAANNISKPAGYYKLNADAAALTYTAVATAWGVIGDATPQGWNDETALAYDPALQTWTGGMTLTLGSFKFRANHSWDYNYGSTAANATLDAGGSNIPVTLASDYYFVLDLSHPNAYVYSANRWGLIGDATPDGWNSDQNMSWDAANKAMTITLDLVVGSIKFRANDAWDLNLGGDLSNLTQGGANIPITTAGNYTVKLYISGAGGHCTITQNKKRK